MQTSETKNTEEITHRIQDMTHNPFIDSLQDAHNRVGEVKSRKGISITDTLCKDDEPITLLDCEHGVGSEFDAIAAWEDIPLSYDELPKNYESVKDLPPEAFGELPLDFLKSVAWTRCQEHYSPDAWSKLVTEFKEKLKLCQQENSDNWNNDVLPAMGFYIDDLYYPLSKIDMEKQVAYSDVYGSTWDYTFQEISYFVDWDGNTVEVL